MMKAVYSLLPDLQARIDTAMERATPLRCDFNVLIRDCPTSAVREAAVLALTAPSSFPSRQPPLLEQMVEAIEEACIDPNVRRDMAQSVCEIHIENVDATKGSKAITWVTQPLPALVYAGCFETGRGGGFSRAEWRDFFEDVFHARERMLVGHFTRVSLPRLQSRARDLLSRSVSIVVDMQTMLATCERQARLAVVQTICTDTGKRRQLRRAGQVSRQLLDEAKHLAVAVGAQITDHRSKHEENDSIQLAPIDDTSSITATDASGPTPSVPAAARAQAPAPVPVPATTTANAGQAYAVPHPAAAAAVATASAPSATLLSGDVVSPPGDDDDDQFFDSSESLPGMASVPNMPAAASAGEVDPYARVAVHLLSEPTLSPNVVTPVLNMAAWAIACDPLNRSVLADGIAKIVVKCVSGTNPDKKSIRLLSAQGDPIAPSVGLLAPPLRDCTIEYAGVFASGFRGCFSNTELYNFFEAHFHCHERALMNKFHTSPLPAESLRLSIALGQPLPIELAWETLLPTNVSPALRIEALKVMCSKFFLSTIVDALVSIIKTNDEAKDIMSAILRRVVIRGSPTRGRPSLELLPITASALGVPGPYVTPGVPANGPAPAVSLPAVVGPGHADSASHSHRSPPPRPPRPGETTASATSAAHASATDTHGSVAVAAQASGPDSSLVEAHDHATPATSTSSAAAVEPAAAADGTAATTTAPVDTTSTTTLATANTTGSSSNESTSPARPIPPTPAGHASPALAGLPVGGPDEPLPQSQLVLTYYLLAGPRGCFDGEDIKENVRRVLSLSTPESERGLGRVGRRLGREAQLVAADIGRLGQRLSSSFSKWLSS